MKRLLVLACMVVLCSCKVEKTGKDTYKVVAPTPQAKAAAEKAKVQAAAAAQKFKREAGEAAQRAGSALKNAGREVESHTGTTTSSETTQTTSTAEAPGTATTATATHVHVSRRH